MNLRDLEVAHAGTNGGADRMDVADGTSREAVFELPVPGVQFGREDCELFDRYPQKVRWNSANIAAADQDRFKDLRGRLKRLAEWLASVVSTDVSLRAHTSLYQQNGYSQNDIWCCVYPSEVPNKSYTLQVALIISARGAELCLCLGAGRSQLADPAARAEAEQALAELRAALSSVPDEVVGAIRAELPSDVQFRRGWRQIINTADFGTLKEWLDYAAGPDGAGASVSRVLGVEDLERLGPGIANVLLELANASSPLFEYCFLGEGRMGTAAGAHGGDAVAPTVAFDAASLEALASSAPYHLELDSGVYRAVAAAVLSGKHLILTGPPGTAKTTLAELTCQLAQAAGYCTGYMLTTATADWTTYETIGGLRPVTSGGRLEFRQGHFLEAAAASQWLIIDELNRSNFDRAFGQLFTVLSGQSVVLPYEDPGTNKRIALQLEDGSSQYDTEGHMVLTVPASWRIIATMNVFDKSLLFEMSFALMRRFAFVEVAAPAPETYVALWSRELRDLSPDTRAMIDAALTGLLSLRSIKEIGPAVFLDMARFAREYMQDGAEVTQSELTFQLFYSYLLPQFEGIDNPTGRILYRKVRTLVGEARNQRLRRILSDVLGLVLPAAISEPEDDPEQADTVATSTDEEEAPGLS